MSTTTNFDRRTFMKSTAMAAATARLGQDLFYPPNVKGWDGNRAWVNANAVLLRYNLPAALVRRRPQPGPDSYMGQAALDSAKAMKPAMQDTMMRSESRDRNRPGPWNPRRLFASLEFKTAGECVDAMAHHFLCVPLSQEQRAILLHALDIPGGADAAMTGRNVKPRNVLASLHLLLSTAEYQLC